MIEIIDNIFLTGALVFMLLVGFIKFRDECGDVGDIEKHVVVIMLLSSLAVTVVSAFIFIWI